MINQPVPLMPKPQPRTVRPSRSIALALSLAIAALAYAQPQPPASPPPAPTAAPEPAPAAAPAEPAPATLLTLAPADVDAVTARSLARIAMIDVRVPESVREGDFALAAELLDIASSLQPKDAELLRLLIEAREQAGELDRAAELRRRLLALDPRDTVLAMGVIADRLGRLQDVDSRLSSYDRLLSEGGSSLDESVRSRLALDSALLLRERGDAAGFTDRLRLALKLDSTNKDAAALLYTFVSQGDTTPAQRLEAILLLLYADPVDGQTHRLLGQELSAGGALVQAKRFLTNAGDLAAMFGGGRDPGIEAAIEVARWRMEGPSGTATRIADLVRKPREQLARQIEAAKQAATKSGEPIGELPKPEDIRLPAELERLWLFAASAAGDSTLTEAALAEIEESMSRAEAGSSNPDQRLAEVSVEAARAEAAVRRLDFLRAALLTGLRTERAAEVLPAVLETSGLAVDGRRALEGWMALRNGVLAAAETKFAEVESRAPIARLGRGQLEEQRGNKPAAAEAYLDAARMLGDTPAGAWAATAYARVSGSSIPAPPEAAALEAMAAGVPKWIDELIRDNRRLTRLAVHESAQTIGPLDRLGLKLKLRNTSPAPLALGAEKALNSRVLVAPRTEIGSSPMGNALPNVFSIERRLRLKPGEEVEIELWPDGGFSGWFMELGAGQIARTTYRVLQGFRPREGGGYEVGPLGLSGESGSVIRRSFTGGSAPIASVIRTLSEASRDQLPEALGMVRYRLFRDHRGLERIPAPQRAELLATLTRRYTEGDAGVRILMLAMLPTGKFILAFTPFDEAVLATPETDPRVDIARIITRAIVPDAPAIVAGKAAADGTLKRVASLSEERLTDLTRRSFSRMSTAAVPEEPQPAAPAADAPNASPASPSPAAPKRP